jgi:hypothetical protein
MNFGDVAPGKLNHRHITMSGNVGLDKDGSTGRLSFAQCLGKIGDFVAGYFAALICFFSFRARAPEAAGRARRRAAAGLFF